MAARDRSHILLRGRARAEAYTSHGVGDSRRGLPQRDPDLHSAALRQSLDRAVQEGLARRERVSVEVDERASGLLLEFESFPGIELALKSLENHQLKRPIELRAVNRTHIDPDEVQRAVVFVPDEARGVFFRRLDQYASEQTLSGAPKHRNLFDRLQDIRLATLESFWTEATLPFPPADEPFWWEVWLRRDEGREIERFLRFAVAVGAEVHDRRLAFDERTVVLSRATPRQLSESIDVLDDLAELRQARVLAGFFEALEPHEQADWIEELLDRASFSRESHAPAVCILDTGVRAEHPLLRPALDAADLHSVEPGWGTADHDGHGTEMAGLALYGCTLADRLADSEPLVVPHLLESVKILPPPPQANDPELYGAITAEAVSRVEIQAPHRRRAFSMAVTCVTGEAIQPRAYGQPTSWSAAVDALAAGRSFVTLPAGLDYLDPGDPQSSRLIVVAAGNVPPQRRQRNHLDRSDVEPIDDPAHAWNALTVGAFTDLTCGAGPILGTPVALPGELSPHSRTSVAFERQWAMKPDILMEGGNVTESPTGEFDTPDYFQLLTTDGSASSRLFTVSNATSAATGQAAGIAARVWAIYPNLWPETVRGLIVHGARWTTRMNARFGDAKTRSAKENLVRRYGIGVPTLERVQRSAANELVLVAEDTIHPFAGGKLREMHLHQLPWPLEELERLGETPARLRVALSYFVHPNPSRRGWAPRFRYASHGLRFDVKQPTESIREFRKRLNKQALAEDETRPKKDSDSDRWLLGPTLRSRGSLHCDLWEGTAADLAARGVLAVFPVSGWWKELPTRDRSDQGVRYALIVAIETPEVEVDLWTPVSAKAAAAVSIVEA